MLYTYEACNKMHKSLIIVCLVELAILFSVEAVSMSVTPSSMVVGSANSVTRLELRCSSDGTINNGIYSFVIARRRFTEIEYSSLVIIDTIDGVKQDPNLPLDIVAKSPNITGGLAGTSGTLTMTMDGSSITCSDQAEFRCEMTYKLTGIAGSQASQESTNFTVIKIDITGGLAATSGTLTMTIDASSITCNDQAEFRCEMTYKLIAITGSHIALDSANFTVITVPNDFRITDALYEDKGFQLQLTNDSKLAVGTRITYRCSANIGSDSSLAIVWERSSMFGASTDFTTYTPTVSTDIVQDPVVQGSCSFTRTSTMYYNMTILDDDGITFRCKVRVYVGNQWYEPTSIHRRTFTNLPRSSTEYRTTVRTTATSSAVHIDGQEGSHVSIHEVLAIVLGVLFGVSVILILFLSICLQRYRKLAEELQCRSQSRPQIYDGLKVTVESSAPYAVLNREPPVNSYFADNHQQSDYVNAYDRRNRTVGHSEPYEMLGINNSDRGLPKENKPYVNMEHNVL